jgi:hypothetical protein
VYDFIAGVTEFDAAEAGPVPTLLVAVAVQLTATALASPVTVIGEAVPDTVCVPHVAA